MPKHWKIYKTIKQNNGEVDFVIFNHKPQDKTIEHSTVKINHILFLPEQCNLKNLQPITHEEFMLILL